MYYYITYYLYKAFEWLLLVTGQDINACPVWVVLHVGHVDRPKYLSDRTSKLKHIENDCLFVISWHFNLRVIFPRSPFGSLLKDWNQLRMSNAWANHSMRYQCIRLFSQYKVDRGWLVNVIWSRKFQAVCFVYIHFASMCLCFTNKYTTNKNTILYSTPLINCNCA